MVGTVATAMSMLLFGCTTPDPENVFNTQVSEFDVQPLDTSPPEGCLTEPIDFSGEYFFAFATSIRPDLPIYFQATITTAADLSTFDISLQPLSYDADPEGVTNPDPRQPVGVIRDETGVAIASDGTWELTLNDWLIPGPGNPVTGGDLSANIVMTGAACLREHFCGTATGEVIGTSLAGSTFGATLIEDGVSVTDMPVEAACRTFGSGDDVGGDTGGDTTPDPPLVDQCLNEADLAIANGEPDPAGIAADCGILCAADPEASACTVSCMQDGANLDDDDPDNDIVGVPISDGCGSCYGDTVLCAIDNCFLVCLNGPDSEECATCRTDAGCDDVFRTCFGEEPLVDQCIALDDYEIVSRPEPSVSDIAKDCGISCLGDGDPASCTQTCMEGNADLADLNTGCISCYTNTVLCSIQNCIPACMAPSSDACVSCQAEFNCITDFETCHGVPPTTLCDDTDQATLNDDAFVVPTDDLTTCVDACDTSCADDDDVEGCTGDCIDLCTATSADSLGISYICTSCFTSLVTCDTDACDNDFAACTAAPE